MTNVELALQFFLQIAVILATCRVVGVLARLLGQPQVVAEMFAGILLGPSFLGWFWPELQAWLFPWDLSQQTRDTQSYLFPASQLGLTLYMFVVGLEFRSDMLRQNLRCSLAVSTAGMVAPFILGGLLAWVLHAQTQLFPAGTNVLSSVLFLGASLSVTAFPMLARILEAQGQSKSLVGTIAMGAAAIGDVAAWCLLAIILGTIEGDLRHALRTILGGIVFSGTAILLVRPAWRRIAARFLDKQGRLHEAGFASALVVMSVGAWFTDRLGLHSVFGAFVVGAIVPRGVIERDLASRIQPLVAAMLLPLFFTYSGLHTRIGLMTEASHWGICGLILLAAIFGKGVACYLVARRAGLTSHQSLAIGSLMNARGLMELIMLNVGLERGLITEELFTMLVVMAIVTTLMAAPIFSLALREKPR